MSTATQTGTTKQINELAERYGEAWNSGSLEAIMALHTDDTVFCLHGAGTTQHGADAVRESFAASFAQWAGLHFEPRRVLCGEDFFVFESEVTATLQVSTELDGVGEVQPGASVKFDAVDVITVRDGLVATKHTYIDALAIQAQLTN
jgi:ketosteroid isomerase-like protein